MQVYLDEPDSLTEAIMESSRKELGIKVPSPRAFIDATLQVKACLRKSGIKDGLLFYNADQVSIPFLRYSGTPLFRQEIFI